MEYIIPVAFMSIIAVLIYWIASDNDEVSKQSDRETIQEDSW